MEPRLDVEMDTSGRAHSNYFSLGLGILWQCSPGLSTPTPVPRLNPLSGNQEPASGIAGPDKNIKEKEKEKKRKQTDEQNPIQIA